MIKRYYKIAGHIIGMEYESGGSGLAALCEFEETELPVREDIHIRLMNGAGLFSNCYGIVCYCGDDTYPNVFLSQKHPGIRMVTDKSYENAVIEGYAGGFHESVMELLLVELYSWLARKSWLLLHASCVDYKGNGLLFTGRSGIGKTTQARLWMESFGAEIINGDKVLLHGEAPDKISAWGSPWRGSSPYAQNRSVELKALIVLEQSETNQIRELRGMEKLQFLSPHVFYPFWDKKCLNKGMGVMDKLSGLPVYLLSCRPEEAAARLTYDTVFERIAEEGVKSERI